MLRRRRPFFKRPVMRADNRRRILMARMQRKIQRRQRLFFIENMLPE